MSGFGLDLLGRRGYRFQVYSQRVRN